MKASEIIDRAMLVLQDEGKVRWLDSEAFKWLTDGQRAIVLVRPDACVANVTVTLVLGTRQTLPAGALRLLDVMRNMPTSTAPNTLPGGRAIRLVDREVMDSQNPNWHVDTPAAVIAHFVFDNRDPTTYYVSPPAKAGAKIEILYSKIPVAVTALTDDLTVNDIYADPLLNYLLFRCYSKDAQFVQNAQLAAAYLQTFMAMLGLKSKKDAAFSPDLNAKGALPNAAALQMEGV